MAILNIVKDGDELLRKKSRPVEAITPRITALIGDMIETMRKANGVGLAAVQVGILRRLVVIETEEGNPRCFINPVITERKGSDVKLEGCLSVPGKYGEVSRPMQVTVQCQNRNGETVEYHGSELLARAFCHEIDHLDGKLFTDFVTEYLE
jgi:peptide deformylase